MRNKEGFTLLEMCLVLSFIALLYLLLPVNTTNSSRLHFECEKLSAYIKRAQVTALKNRRIVNVEIKSNGVFVDEKWYTFSPSFLCDEYVFYFNGHGNINMANTVNCYYQGREGRIVMNLGNGNIYVKR